MAKVETATDATHRASELTLPSMASAPKPNEMRPQAEAKFQPASRNEDDDGVRSIEVPKIGMKKGGTRSGKTPMELPKSNKTKRASLKSCLQTYRCR
jgi:hypothetical protein